MKKLIAVIVLSLFLVGMLGAAPVVPIAECQSDRCAVVKKGCTDASWQVYYNCKAAGGYTLPCFLESDTWYAACMRENLCSYSGF